MKLNADICAARAEAYREAADRLELHWTNCKLEIHEGLKLAAKLRKEQEKWLDREIELS